jgi:hypothetical protein
MAVRRFRVALTPAACNTIVCAEQSFVVTDIGLSTGSAFVGVSKPTINGAISPTQGRVIDSTHIGVTFCNPTAGNVTPTAGEAYEFLVID